MRCGLLGGKLGHSYSPRIHQNLGSYSYELFEKQPEELEDFLKYGEFDGLNVTIPYKKAVIPFLSELSPRAQKLGAVNTVIRRADGTLVGHNTDYAGFLAMVRDSGIDVTGQKALVLGSGGASVTVRAVLEELGARVITVSRKGSCTYDDLELHQDAVLLVNATPVGMYPNTGLAPLELDRLPNLRGVLDLIYNPARTRLLLEAERRGLVTRNGLLMLVAQAKESAEWFTGASLPDTLIPEIHRKLRLEMENIILIGMPGSGKSTVGKILSQALGKTFVDADEFLEKRTGRTTASILLEDGEERFRQLETEVLETLGSQSDLIIATGGGCVTRSENYPLLHQNGRIICLKRDLRLLSSEGRPLSRTTTPEEMAAVRRPLYKAFADAEIENNGTPEDAVRKIMEVLS